MPTKRCTCCGGEYSASFFGRNHHARYPYLASGSRAICKGCEQAARDARKKTVTGRWREKISSTIRRHATRLGYSAQALRDTYGWTIDRMSRDAEHAYRGSCLYCGALFETMVHGPTDLTLDIVNREEPPYYTTNTRWVCVTCNRQKSRTPAAVWGALRAAWDAWKKRPKAPEQMRLFED